MISEEQYGGWGLSDLRQRQNCFFAIRVSTITSLVITYHIFLHGFLHSAMTRYVIYQLTHCIRGRIIMRPEMIPVSSSREEIDLLCSSSTTCRAIIHLEHHYTYLEGKVPYHFHCFSSVSAFRCQTHVYLSKIVANSFKAVFFQAYHTLSRTLSCSLSYILSNGNQHLV